MSAKAGRPIGNVERFDPGKKRVANPCLELCYQVMLSAYKDLVTTRIHEQHYKRAAIHFFESGDYKAWAELAGIEPDCAMRGYYSVLENGLPARGVDDGHTTSDDSGGWGEE